MMKITFYLPGADNVKSGGYKVIFKYSEMLADRGHDVSIIYSNHNMRGVKFIYNILPLRKMLVYRKFGDRPTWYDLDDRVKVIYAFKGYDDPVIPDADVVIATAVDTAEEVAKLPASKGEKWYFVQGHEIWVNGEEYCNYSYTFPLKKITISEYLKKLIARYSNEKIFVVKNAIQLDKFYVTNPIRNRDKYSVAMLNHRLQNKGSRYGIEAIKMLKDDYPQLKAHLFGTCERPVDLPDWITYTQNASEEELLKIYNSAAIFVSPVINEGFGLTGAESMACGCALVSCDYDAVHEYAVDGDNAMLCPIKDSKALYKSMKKCIEDDTLRFRLAEQGVKDTEVMSWEKCTERFEQVLKGDYIESES